MAFLADCKIYVEHLSGQKNPSRSSMVLHNIPLERRTLMGTTILSFQNRVVIETLHNEGRSLRYIANYLGFSKTTIFNELHRLNSEYQAGLAQTDFERKVSQRGRKSSLTKNL
ncbi:IS30 family transposase [Limosilactobacillus fermentum]|nr:IS30 family transposase [Limosilactobacillus fermentum]